ncbi:MAG: ribosomal protein S18-alanine N-acetyltransferase [Candidatus Binatia bacterium]
MESSREKSGEESTAYGFVRPDPSVRLRPLHLADLDQVMKIERASFSSPWSYRFFMEELKAPCARSLLAEVEERAVGYIVYWTLPQEVDVHNVAVERSYRRRGIARLLLQSVIDEAAHQSLERVTLEVRKSNQPAQLLYRCLGFTTKGIRKGYYSDNGEDALIMVLDLKRPAPV